MSLSLQWNQAVLMNIERYTETQSEGTEGKMLPYTKKVRTEERGAQNQSLKTSNTLINVEDFIRERRSNWEHGKKTTTKKKMCNHRELMVSSTQY